YGEFLDLGTPRYRYVIKDRAGLATDVGEGIYPNTDVNKDPTYQKLFRAGQLSGSQWRFVDNRTPAINFYKWTTAAEDPGVKQFYTGMMFESLCMLREGAKAFYAVAVHFPRAIGYTYFSTPWYMGPASLDRLE